MKDSFPDLNKWKEYSKKDIMSAVYWSQGQLPPSDPVTFEKEWQNIKKQLEVKYPQ